MNKWHLLLLALSMTVAAAFIGCGDDDCASCPETVTPLGHTQGMIRLQAGYTSTTLDVFSNGAVAPNIDSVRVGDSLVDLGQGWELYSMWPYVDAHWLITFNESGDPSTSMYDHGDLATINVWGEGRSGMCQVKILDPSLAMTEIIAAGLVSDTIDPGESTTVVWHKIENVDYYAVMIAWRIIPQDRYIFSYYYSVDTTFEITGAMQPTEIVSDFNVHVTPFNGPDPRTGQTNWTGNLLDGVVYSYGQQGMTMIDVVEPPSALKSLPEGLRDTEPETRSEDIVARVYEKYRN